MLELYTMEFSNQISTLQLKFNVNLTVYLKRKKVTNHLLIIKESNIEMIQCLNEGKGIKCKAHLNQMNERFNQTSFRISS